MKFNQKQLLIVVIILLVLNIVITMMTSGNNITKSDLFSLEDKVLEQTEMSDSIMTQKIVQLGILIVSNEKKYDGYKTEMDLEAITEEFENLHKMSRQGSSKKGVKEYLDFE